MKRDEILPVCRDVVIVWVLTAMGGFIVGVATGGPSQDEERFILAAAISNLLFGSLAFTISGCLAPPRRWRHLAFVAVGAWLTGLINMVFFDFSIGQWIVSAIFMAVVMGIGGGFSFLFKSKTMEEEKLEQAHGLPVSGGNVSSNDGDDKFYNEVARELQEKQLVAGLWTRVYAEMGGDDAQSTGAIHKVPCCKLKRGNAKGKKQQIKRL